jgi:hypothetical protein
MDWEFEPAPEDSWEERKVPTNPAETGGETSLTFVVKVTIGRRLLRAIVPWETKFDS